MLGGQGAAGRLEEMGMDGNGIQVGDFRWWSPPCSTPWPGAMPWRHSGAKSRRANPGVGLGYVGAYLAASASRNGLAKS